MFSHKTLKIRANSTREVRSSSASCQEVRDLRSAIRRRRPDQSPVPFGANTFWDIFGQQQNHVPFGICHQVFRPICVNCQSAPLSRAHSTRLFWSRSWTKRTAHQKKSHRPSANQLPPTKTPPLPQIHHRDSIYIELTLFTPPPI